MINISPDPFITLLEYNMLLLSGDLIISVGFTIPKIFIISYFNEDVAVAVKAIRLMPVDIMLLTSLILMKDSLKVLPLKSIEIIITHVK